MIWIFYLFLGITILTVVFGFILSGPGYDGPKSEHFDGKRFVNPNGLQAQNLIGVMKYGLFRKPEKWVKNYETDVRSESIPPVQESQVQISFVNHSTFLIQVAGLNILTDPVWSKRCSPFQWVGPERMRPPGISMDQLPPIDLVLLSHNHYDHLDVNTVKEVKQRFNPQFIVPLGVGAYFNKLGIDDVEEIDWHQKINKSNIVIKGVPGSHFTSRGLFDRDKTLWCGYLLEIDGYKIYFAGDTGYGDNFKAMGEQEGVIDLALIPIGAYKPEWFMSPIHISPDQAVQVHNDVNAKQSIAMHFGTFPLADDGMDTPAKDLLIALDKYGVNKEKFIIPDEGKSYVFDMVAE